MDVTKIRAAEVLVEYKGMMVGIVVRDHDLPEFSCYYCKTLRGSAHGRGVERYLQSGAACQLGRHEPASESGFQ